MIAKESTPRGSNEIRAFSYCSVLKSMYPYLGASCRVDCADSEEFETNVKLNIVKVHRRMRAGRRHHGMASPL